MTRMAKNWTEDIVGIVRMQDNLFGFGDLRTFQNRISADFHCLSLSPAPCRKITKGYCLPFSMVGGSNFL